MSTIIFISATQVKNVSTEHGANFSFSSSFADDAFQEIRRIETAHNMRLSTGNLLDLITSLKAARDGAKVSYFADDYHFVLEGEDESECPWVAESLRERAA